MTLSKFYGSGNLIILPKDTAIKKNSQALTLVHFQSKWLLIVGWMVAIKKACLCPYPQHLWMLFGKGVLADVTKLRILRREDHSGFSQWVLNPMTSILRYTEKTDTEEKAMWK